MVQLTKLFKPVASMEADEARDYIAKHQEGDYLILDVRQPGEYEDSHIPGAKLLPLPELANSYQDPGPGKTHHRALRHWRPQPGGGPDALRAGASRRSITWPAGIKAYQGPKAAGPQELNLDLVRGDETPAEIITLAYGMEKALQLFYETMLDRQSQDQELQALFGQLARVEVHHEQRLFEVYSQLEPAGARRRKAFEAAVVPPRPWKAASMPRNFWKPTKPTCKPRPRCSTWP